MFELESSKKIRMIKNSIPNYIVVFGVFLIRYMSFVSSGGATDSSFVSDVISDIGASFDSG